MFNTLYSIVFAMYIFHYLKQLDLFVLQWFHYLRFILVDNYAK